MKLTVIAQRTEDSDRCYVYVSSFEGGEFPVMVKVWIPRRATVGTPPDTVKVKVEI